MISRLCRIEPIEHLTCPMHRQETPYSERSNRKKSNRLRSYLRICRPEKYGPENSKNTEQNAGPRKAHVKVLGRSSRSKSAIGECGVSPPGNKRPTHGHGNVFPSTKRCFTK